MRLDLKWADTDMAEDLGEQFYARLYLHFMLPKLPTDPNLNILDAGCQSGRFAIPLAQAGHAVTGVDINTHWIERCRAHCAEAGVQMELLCEDIRDAIPRFPRRSFDVVLCTELLYTTPDFRDILKGFRPLLRNGGRLIASHRTRYYMLSMLMRYRKLDTAETVLHSSEGVINGNYYNWYDEHELRKIYADAGFRIVQTKGIGTLSAIGPDALARVMRPTDLKAPHMMKLLRLEQACAQSYRHIARYLFVLAEPT